MSDNSHLLNQIDDAIAAHAMWKLRIDNAMKGKDEDFDLSVAGDNHACAFGKWLDSEKDHLKKEKLYDQVFELHAQVHQQIASILSLVRQGEKAKAAEAMGIDSVYRDVSARLVRTLMHWKDGL